VLGAFLRDTMARNEQYSNFRIFGPDETASNRLGGPETTGRTWMARTEPDDDAALPGRPGSSTM